MENRYYIYAGYYELHLTKTKLDAPFVLWGDCPSFQDMINEAERLDPDAQLIFYKDLVDEAVEYFGLENAESLCVA